MFPEYFGKTIRVKKSYQVSYFLNPTDFETDDEDEVMDWYLFDQGVDEEPTADDVVDDDVSSNLQALIAAVIQIIEHAEQVRQGGNVTPGLMVFLPKASEDDAFTKRSPQLSKLLFSLHADGAEPGRYRDREKAGGPSGRLQAYGSCLLNMGPPRRFTKPWRWSMDMTPCMLQYAQSNMPLDVATRFKLWWTTQTAIIKVSTSKWIWQNAERLLQL